MNVQDFTPVPALIGGALIGLSASLLLLSHGKVAGISGIFGALLRVGTTDRSFRASFLLGLLGTGLVLGRLLPGAFVSSFVPGLPLALLAGVVVGVGTQLGSGCTSGHGVCGISRLSVRSLLATGTFMATGFATVFILRHVLRLGGTP
jgi:uncharacterized membrane protein YedE/YeeE